MVRLNLVLPMDKIMPIISGFEAIGMIRTYEKKNQLTPVPIIGMYRHGFIATRTDFLEAGANDFLARPIRRDDLMDAIDGLLSERNEGAKCRYKSFY
ncbi:hypothetical protein D9758_005966 [Tetrapyrgos nigripes]|uniref:Response regulatory domain-containing protein n=1 Tax=Tetrapyrgos nigripes TaxID=182062 RepID=A0A8H5LHI0_9AGAR|nr:hypothetical protein D9758_005966 [Tetrapyrgos nigripes]